MQKNLLRNDIYFVSDKGVDSGIIYSELKAQEAPHTYVKLLRMQPTIFGNSSLAHWAGGEPNALRETKENLTQQVKLQLYF